ncbi:MAG: hypothetical protein N2B06_08240 [Clostridium sp.]
MKRKIIELEEGSNKIAKYYVDIPEPCECNVDVEYMDTSITFQALDWQFVKNDIYCFGRTVDNSSITIKLKGVIIPFYINVQQKSNEEINYIINYLKNRGKLFSLVCRKIFGCNLNYGINGLEDKMYNFIRIDCNSIIDFYVWRKRFTYGFKDIIDGKSWNFGIHKLYNANLKPLLTIFHNYNIMVHGYFKLEKYVYSNDPANSAINVDININDLTPLESTEIPNNPHLKIASFDIESEGTNPNVDRVIQIGITLYDIYDPVETNIKYLLSFSPLRPCGDIPDITVINYKKEKDLIIGFIDLLSKSDFDVITGYNIFGFDLKFLYKRAELFGIQTRFLHWNRVLSDDFKGVLQCKGSGKGEGFNEQYYLSLNGRIQMDLLPIMRKNFKCDRYTLSFVSQEFLNDDKIDLSYKQMMQLWNRGKGSTGDLAIIGEYCVKDTILPIKLILKLGLITNATEYSNIAYFPLAMTFLYGETAKSWSQICYEAEQQKYVISNDRRPGRAYQGATVLEPKKGMYLDNAVGVFDFKSLYPSIMIAENMCPTTFCTDRALIAKHPNDFQTFHINGRDIVYYQKRKGIVPTVLEKLLSTRARVKKEMKTHEKGSFLYRKLDAKQLAVKVSANSIYGFFGVKTGIYPLTEISEAVTFTGRNMIEMTKNYVENNYDGMEVIYGDTDSVMVKFPSHYQGKELFDKAIQMSKEMNVLYKSPNELEFEKMYSAYLLKLKKKYTGLYQEIYGGKVTNDITGLEPNRRDGTKLMKMVLIKIYAILLKDKRPFDVVKYVKEFCISVLEENQPQSLFELSKKLGARYKNGNLPHVVLAKKVNERSLAEIYTPGDRIPYVFVDCKFKKNVPQYLRVDDPQYVKDNGLKLDYKYYITKQLMLPVISSMEFTDYPAQLRIFFKMIENGADIETVKLFEFKMGRVDAANIICRFIKARKIKINK